MISYDVHNNKNQEGHIYVEVADNNYTVIVI